MLDTNNDGVISKVELIDFCGVHGISVPKATKALGKPVPRHAVPRSQNKRACPAVGRRYSLLPGPLLLSGCC